MRYRLLAADLDGTLKAEGQAFSLRVRAAVKLAQDKGVHVVIATGRMYRTAEYYARDLGLAEAIICDHGATIRDLDTGGILFKLRMPPELARSVVEAADPELTLLACIDEEFYTEHMTQAAVLFAGRYAQEHLHRVPNLAQVVQAGPQKLIFIHEPAVITRQLEKLIAAYGDRLQVVQSYPRYVELTHLDASKGKAVEWLARRWGIQRQQVIAIGDQDNDRSMIEWAGLGAAMGNAVASVRAVARYVAPAVEQDGVAAVIERFVLEQNAD